MPPLQGPGLSMNRWLTVLALLVSACAGILAQGTASWARHPQSKEQTAILVGAGDIADCKALSGAEATAKLLDKIPGIVFAAGDLAYPDGSKENFQCYDKTWGRAKSRTRPSPGNHEFHAAGARPYFDYFGPAAGDPKTGYYSYELGSWHIIVLNSECKDVGGCEAGSSQEKQHSHTPYTVHYHNSSPPLHRQVCVNFPDIHTVYEAVTLHDIHLNYV